MKDVYSKQSAMEDATIIVIENILIGKDVGPQGAIVSYKDRQCRLHQTWGIIPALVRHPVAIPPGAASGGQLPVTCHPIAIPEARDGDPADPLTAAIRPSTDATSVNGATVGGQLRIVCSLVAIPEEQDRRPEDPSTATIRPSTNATSVNGASAGQQLRVICPPVANPEKQPANPSTAAIRLSTKAMSVNCTIARGQLSVICPPVVNSEAQDHGLLIPLTPAIYPPTNATSVNGTIVDYVATSPLADCHENDLLHQNATATVPPSGSQEGSPFRCASPPANSYRPSAPTIPTVDTFTGGGASIVGEIILPRNVDFVAQPFDQVTEEGPLENVTTAVNRMSINPPTNDPIDVATDSPKIGLNEFNISVSIDHPTVDTCVDEINHLKFSRK